METSRTEPTRTSGDLPSNHHAHHPGFAGVGGLVAAAGFSVGRTGPAALAARLTGVAAGDDVVDIGCGPGTAVRHAASLGAASVVGVDPAAVMLRMGRLLTARSRARSRIRFVEGAAESRRLPDRSATVVWSLSRVHQWQDLDADLAEVVRILRRPGRFFALERRTRPGATGHASHGWTDEQAHAFAQRCRDVGLAAEVPGTTSATGACSVLARIDRRQDRAPALASGHSPRRVRPRDRRRRQGCGYGRRSAGGMGRRMKFGIFFEMSTPRPFTTEVESSVFHNALEQARLADELGFDWVWAVEHHFLEEYSHCSAPEVVLAAVAAQTERVRIGHGAVVCVPEMNHPIRVAERCATLDLISKGRLEVGTARSSTWTELGGFEVDPDDTKKTWDEFVRVLPKMWADGHVSHEGRCFSMPERNVLPKPVQKPHPPMWVTVTSPGTELDAAERGLGCLGVAAAGYAEQERRTNEYFRRIENCDPVGGVVTREVTTLNFLYCHEDPAHAAKAGMNMVGTFGLTNSHLMWTREAYPTRAYQSLGNLAPRTDRPKTGGPGDAYGIPEGICVGDPEIIVAALKRWESLGLTGINFLLNGLEVIPQADVLASLRLFADEVMPHFKKGDASAC